MKHLKLRKSAFFAMTGLIVAGFAATSANAQDTRFRDNRVVVLQCKVEEGGVGRLDFIEVSGGDKSFGVDEDIERHPYCANLISALLESGLTIHHTEVVPVSGEVTFNFVFVGGTR